MPDFKTIANFRKENAKALRAVCREFVVLCRNLGLSADALVAIDSSRFKAVTNRDRNFTVAKMKRRLEQIEGRIDRSMNGHQAIMGGHPSLWRGFDGIFVCGHGLDGPT